jgi:HSP20 family molecular chaperone IbpA
MSSPARREQRAWVFPDLMDMLDTPFWGWRQAEGSANRPHTPRAEDYMEKGKYIIRMELPGIDPDKDVDIMINGDKLQMTAHREAEKKEGRHTEFRYGSYTRTIPLPHGVTAKDINASYEKGILTISMPLPETGKASQHIPVQATGK